MSTVYRRTALTGGGATALDQVDGNSLSDGDVAFVFASNVFYVYILDADSGAAESSPAVISPDTNAGTKRWILQAITAGTITADHIGESTTGHGVNIDGLSIVDGAIVGQPGSWKQVPAANYTAAPASTSTITMGVDMTASIKAGMTFKFTDADGTKYGIVTAVANNLLTIAGAALDHNLTGIWYDGGTLTQVVVGVNGTYEDATNSTLIASDNKMQLVWRKPVSYCVYFQAYSLVHDSHATHGAVTPMINSAALSTANTNTGVLIAANTTWYASGVDINQSNYDINPGEVIEIQATKGGTGDASDLTVIMIFVTP